MSTTKYEKGVTDEVNVKMMPDSERPTRPPEEEVEKYRTTRLVLVVIFLIVLIAMTVAAVVIIATAERCEKAEKGKPAEKQVKSWWEESVAYQINVPSFDNGKLSDVSGRISKFKERSIPVLCLSPIFDKTDLKKVDSNFGTMKEFETLVEKLHKNDIRLVLDFDPTVTSEDHPWFTESQANKDSKEGDYYIWKDNNTAINSSSSPPNDWKNGADSAWKYDVGRKQSYLVSSSSNPKLNYEDASLKAEIKKTIDFWLKKKVDGIKLHGVDELLVNVSADKRKDLPGVHAILQDWRTLFNDTKIDQIMIGQISSPDRNLYYGEDDDELNSVVSYLEVSTNATVLQERLETVFGNLGNHTAAFAVDDLNHGRTINRIGATFANAVNTLMLTLPGTPVLYYGQEMGLSGNADEKMKWGNDEHQVRDAYIKLMKILKERKDFKSEEMSVVLANNGFIAYTRGSHVVAINFGDSDEIEHLKTKLQKSSAKCIFDSSGKLTGESVVLDHIPLTSGQAVILELQ